MIMRCEDYRERMLDRLYGLLDPADEAQMSAHLAECPACAAAASNARDVQQLLATAAKAPFPEVKFQIPIDTEPTKPTPSRVAGRGYRWAIAATLLIGTLGLLTPTIREYFAFRDQQNRTSVAQLDLEKLQQAEAARIAIQKELIAKLDRELQDLREGHGEKLRTWVSAEREASSQPFQLQVTGPVAAIPGGRNEYSIRTQSGSGEIPATVSITVQDSRGKVYHRESLKPPVKTWLLPTKLWDKFPDRVRDIELAIQATTPDGATAELTEPIQLAGPLYSTFLVTDKPLYRPGEAIYFRSLTLNRANLQPPTEDITLRFALRQPDGTLLPSSMITGTAEPSVSQSGTPVPVVGPDGLPVRGIATGVLVLPETLPGGEYTLVAYQLPNGWASKDLPSRATPVATRKILVAKYQPESLEKLLEFDAKSYGPGDTVRAKLIVKNQGKPYANIPILVTATHGKKQSIPLKQPGQLDPNGTADIVLTLPKQAEVVNPTITINILDQHNETLVRPIPMASKNLSLEFFPEGGELIEGVPNRVYFRATSSTGRPADVAGILTDGTQTICLVQTLTDAEHPGVNQGLGSFRFTPEAGKRYAVQLRSPFGVVEPKITHTALAQIQSGFLLPAAEMEGVALSIPRGVIHADEPIEVMLASRETAHRLLLGAYTRGRVVGHQRVTVPAGQQTSVQIPASDDTLGGVTRITVFEEPLDDAHGRRELRPIAERLIFRQPTQKLNLELATQQSTPYSPGDSVRLTVQARDEQGQPVPAILMAAVTNQNVVTMANDRTERSLPTHFLLNGEVGNPEALEQADFLLTNHPRAVEGLDLLLGTQGWRRFVEVDGRFRSTTVSDAEKQRFQISTGRVSVVNDPKRQPVTEGNRSRISELEARLDFLETQKRLAESRLETASPEVEAQRALVAETQSASVATWRRFEKTIDRLSLAMTLLTVILGIVYLVRPCRLCVRVAIYAVVGIGIVFTSYKFAMNGTTSQEPIPLILPEKSTLLETVPPKLRIDLRETVSPNLTPSVKSVEFESSPRADIGPGLIATVEPSPPGQLLRDRAERAEQNYRESGPPIPGDEAALARVKAALVRHSSFMVREYAHQRPRSDPNDPTRTDFTETVLWHPVLVLPETGTATLHFQLSDSTNPYRVLVAGHTLDGRLGATTKLLEVRQPLSVDFKLPAELTLSDRPQVPFTFTNTTAEPITSRIGYWSDYLIAADEPGSITLLPRSGIRQWVDVRPTELGQSRVRVSAISSDHRDAVERTIRVVPEGFPASGSTQFDVTHQGHADLTLPADLVDGTLTVKLHVFTNSLAELHSGLEGMLREPHGCFEQTSSTNYPNILILNHLKDSETTDPQAIEHASDLLEQGYRRLTSFEVPTPNAQGHEGFEWFGSYPAHECLTAYGLMQLIDMAKVYPVDPQLITRTRSYLLACRDGKGGYRRKRDGHAFGDVPDAVANAYITWALSISEPQLDLGPEKHVAVAEALVSRDPYRLALAANFSSDPNLALTLQSLQQPDGSIPGAETTMTRSRGTDRVVETTALASLAWMKLRSTEYALNVTNAVQFLLASRRPEGSFGSTQATILALKAIVEFNSIHRRPAESATMIVRVDGQEVQRLPYNTRALQPVTLNFSEAAKRFSAGSHRIEVESTGRQTYPVQISWAGFRRSPPSHPNAPVKLSVQLTDSEVVEGATTRLHLHLQNQTATTQGMTTAIIGIPAGLRIPTDSAQLRSLKEKPQQGQPALSYWELNGRELVLYWTKLVPQQSVKLNLDLIADLPGTYSGPASRAYLYYSAAEKVWHPPLSIRIRPTSR